MLAIVGNHDIGEPCKTYCVKRPLRYVSDAAEQYNPIISDLKEY